MTQINSVLRRAGIRILIGRSVRAWLLITTALIAALLITLAVERIFAITPPWRELWIGAGAASVILAILWALISAPSQLAVARAVDERAGLRETLSTALCVAKNSDPWSQATVRRAEGVAQRVLVRQAFPSRTPNSWALPLIAGALFGLVWLIAPQGDALGWLAKARADQTEQQNLQEAVAKVESVEKELRDTLASIDDPELEKNLEQLTQPDARDPETVRRAAIKKLTSIRDRLSQLQKSADGLKMEALQDQLKKLRVPGQGPLTKLSQEMQKGNLSGAREELSKLAENLANGEMSDEDKAELAQQLEQLAEQLNKLAEQKNALENQLEQMGLDPELAGNPKALQDALDQLEGLNDEQRQQIMDAAKAVQEAKGAMEQLADGMQQCAECMNNGEGLQQAMQNMGDMLSEMDMMQSELEAAGAAQSQITQQLASLSEMFGEGGGQGASKPFDMFDLFAPKGRGEGGMQMEEAEADFTTRKEKSKTKTVPGAIIARRLVNDTQVRGESRAEFAEAVEAGEATAAEAIDNKAIPREFHDAVKRYFGNLERKGVEEAENTDSSQDQPDDK